MLQTLSTLLAVACLAPIVVVDAAAILYPIVECNTIKVPARNVTFAACATGVFYTPSPAVVNGKPVQIGGYRSEYAVTTGLKEGTDTTTLSEAARARAYANGINIVVERDDDDKCKVTIRTGSNRATICKSCTYCGDAEKYTADCTNAPNGRSVKCESAATSQIFYPMSVAATSAGTTVATPVKAPAKAPVKAPRRATPKAPVKAPVKRPSPR
jgi:hypothetical protein